MKQIVDIMPYHAEAGIQLKWENGFFIEVKHNAEGVIMKANAAGLRSLACHLLALAQDNVPSGSHIQLDKYNALEDESSDFLIEKC